MCNALFNILLIVLYSVFHPNLSVFLGGLQFLADAESEMFSLLNAIINILRIIKFRREVIE